MRTLPVAFLIVLACCRPAGRTRDGWSVGGTDQAPHGEGSPPASDRQAAPATGDASHSAPLPRPTSSAPVASGGQPASVEEPGHATWTMINVTTSTKQADAHLLDLPGGHVFLIDAGDQSGVLVAHLQNRKTARIDKVIVSHLHKDHYAGIFELLESNIEIGEVFMTLPPRAICDNEIPWGCDWADIQRLQAALAKAHVPVSEVHAGDVVYSQAGVELRVLYAFDESTAPFGLSQVNDMSAVMTLAVGKTRALFTGDLTNSIGAFLADHGSDLTADVLKVPHHGAANTAPTAFLTRVGAKAALVPAPDRLWLSGRDGQDRSFYANEKIPTFISGEDGDVTVELSDTGVEISSDNPLKRFSSQ